MKSILASLLTVTSLSMPAANALDWGDVITGMATIGGGIVGNQTCRDERGVVQLFCTGAGAGLGYILGRAVTDHDERSRVNYYNSCMDRFNCGRHQLRDSGHFVEFRQGQRAYWPNRPNMRCRSYTEVVTNRRGRVIHQETKFACRRPNSNVWAPIAPEHYRHMRFYDQQPMRDWRYDGAPATLPPAGPGMGRTHDNRQPPVIGGPVINGPGGQWTTRPAQPQQRPTPPPIAGPADQQNRSRYAPEILPYAPPTGAVR